MHKIVYKHTNTRTGKSYIGWTVKTIEQRWQAHLRSVAAGSRSMFHNAIRKYGIDVWEHQTLGYYETELEAKNAEIQFISEHRTFAFEYPDTGYNMTMGGEGFSSEQVRQLNMTRKISAKTRMKMSSNRRKKKQNQRHLIVRVHCEQHERNRLAACARSREKKQIRKLNSLHQDKQQVIFVVGPDRCGKTNIAHALGNRLNIDVFKSSEERKSFVHDQNRFLNELRYAAPFFCDFLFQTAISLILDRGYPCERVYAHFFDRQTDFDVLRSLDERYSKMGAKILICTRKSFFGIQDDLNPSLDSSALEKISGLYQDFAAWTKCQTFTLFVDDHNLERQISDVISGLKLTGHN